MLNNLGLCSGRWKRPVLCDLEVWNYFLFFVSVCLVVVVVAAVVLFSETGSQFVAHTVLAFTTKPMWP